MTGINLGDQKTFIRYQTTLTTDANQIIIWIVQSLLPCSHPLVRSVCVSVLLKIYWDKLCMCVWCLHLTKLIQSTKYKHCNGWHWSNIETTVSTLPLSLSLPSLTLSWLLFHRFILFTTKPHLHTFTLNYMMLKYTYMLWYLGVCAV